MTNDLEQQIEEWRKLKELSLDIGKMEKGSEERKIKLDELYSGVRKYFQTYKTKFDYCRSPKK